MGAKLIKVAELEKVMNFPAASCGELNPVDFAISTAHSL
jgi:hypothetical protein